MVAALNKRRLKREIELARRSETKERRQSLLNEIKEHFRQRDTSIKAIRLDCREKREALRDSCALRRVRAKEMENAQIGEKRRRLRDVAEEDRTIRQADTRHRRGPGVVRTTARERAQESDDAVRSNLPPELVLVFDVVKKHIKGSPRRSRTEAFLEWAEENPGEVYAIAQADADRHLSKLLAEEERLSRRLRGGRGRGRTAAAVDLADIPF
jgi:hypothetical protein